MTLPADPGHVARRLQRLAQALSGRAWGLRLVETEPGESMRSPHDLGLLDLPQSWVASAAADPGGAGGSVDPASARAWAALRLFVLRQVLAAVEHDTVTHATVTPANGTIVDALTRERSAWPTLLQRVLMMLEAARRDLRLAQAYPGARADLQDWRDRALRARTGLRRQRPLLARLEALQRWALAADRLALHAADREGRLVHVLALADRALDPAAQPTTRVRLAVQICDRLVEGLTLRPRASRSVARTGIGGGAGDTLKIVPADAGAETSMTGSRPGTASDDGQAGDVDDLVKMAEAGTANGRGGRGRPGSPPKTASESSNEAHEPEDRPKTPTAAVDEHPLPCAADGAAGVSAARDGAGVPHDEWDWLAQQYRRQWTWVHEHRLQGTDLAFLPDLRRRHAALARDIRRHLAVWRPEQRQRERRSWSGDEIDMDAALSTWVDRRAGRLGDGRLYTALRPPRRDVCAAFLLDMSGSTSFAVPEHRADAPTDPADDDDDIYLFGGSRRSLSELLPRRRVIDVARDAIALTCDGLHRLGDRHAVFGFSGDGRHQVDFYVAKDFDEAWSRRSAAALGAMQPQRSTRTGAAIRHGVARLMHERARNKLLIIVSDGYPQDTDYGPDPRDVRYGLHDTARALQEAEHAGLSTFCITVDQAAHDYLRSVCAADRYLVIDEVADLPDQLAKVYRRLTLG
jgi:nitric oxide reductase NorD protein